MNFELASRILLHGLSLWDTKEGRKYKDRVIKLREEWNDEYYRKDRSQYALDRIERELCIVGEAFAAHDVGSNGHADSGLRDGKAGGG